MKVNMFTFLVILLFTAICYSENGNDKQAVFNIYEFKEYLDKQLIISVDKARFGDLEGQYINSKGDTCNYRVEQFFNNSPFLKEALREKGITLGHKLQDNKDSNPYSPWIDPSVIIPMLIITATLVLLILNFIWVVRILNAVKNK